MINEMAEKFAAEAEEWIDTPYHHRAWIKHQGCDCGGLLKGVAQTAGLVENVILPQYGEGEDNLERLVDVLAQYSDQVERSPQRGDVIVFSNEIGMPGHAGIMTGSDRFVHAINEPIMKVKSSTLRDPRFGEAIHSVWEVRP
jgi:cell wall-associated NlpC family hydrolase